SRSSSPSVRAIPTRYRRSSPLTRVKRIASRQPRHRSISTRLPRFGTLRRTRRTTSASEHEFGLCPHRDSSLARIQSPRDAPPIPAAHLSFMQVALTIAGSDSGGGAGIQADLKTFFRFGVFGTSAITAITAQNTLGVELWAPVSAELLSKQIDAVASDLHPAAVKSGMVGNATLIRVVADS